MASTADVAAEPTLKPPLHVKFFYGLGQVVQLAGFDTALPFTFFYYTVVLGLSGWLTGLAVGVSLCVDAIVDPLVGSWSDNIKSRWGRRLPLMVLSIPLVALSFGLLFAPPKGLGEPLLFAWLLAGSLAARGATSLFNVPFVALGAELADGYVERSRVVVWRTVIGLISAAAVVILAFSVFFAGPCGLENRDGYPGFGWAVAALLAMGMGLCCAGVARYAAALPQASAVETSMMRRLPGEVAEIFANRSFRILFFSCLATMIAIGVNATFNNHVNVFVWKIGSAEIQSLTFGLLLATLVGAALAPNLARWFEKRSVVMIGVSMLNLAWLILPLLWATGLYRPAGAEATAPLMALVVCAGLGIGLVLVAYPAMMADAADEHELLYGRRREGLYFSGITFAAKAASGVGVLLAGVGLELIGMPKGVGHEASACVASTSALVLSDPVLVRLILAAGPVAAVISTIGVVLMWPYAISREAHDEISARLRARHEV